MKLIFFSFTAFGFTCEAVLGEPFWGSYTNEATIIYEHVKCMTIPLHPTVYCTAQPFSRSAGAAAKQQLFRAAAVAVICSAAEACRWLQQVL